LIQRHVNGHFAVGLGVDKSWVCVMFLIKHLATQPLLRRFGLGRCRSEKPLPTLGVYDMTLMVARALKHAGIRTLKRGYAAQIDCPDVLRLAPQC